MESAGNEKKLQALFRERKLADERLAPDFIKVWRRAESSGPESSRVFTISFAVAAVLLVISLSTLLLWSRSSQQSQPSNQGVVSVPPAMPGLRPSPSPTKLAPTLGVAQVPNRFKSIRRDRRLAAQRQTDLAPRNTAKREGVSITSWQSPTAMLLQSPVDNVLMSLPQLDRALTELKTFLPNTPQ